MQLKSITAKGRIREHVQFATLRRLWATYTKNWESSPLGVAEGSSFSRGAGRVRPTSCPSQSEWFYDFLRGMEYRMGCQLQPNHGLLIRAIIRLLELMREDANEATRMDAVVEANELWKVGAYVCEEIGPRMHRAMHLRWPDDQPLGERDILAESDMTSGSFTRQRT